MKNQIAALAFLALTACVNTSQNPNQELRNAEVCPPGCTCVCEDPTSSSSGSTAETGTVETSTSSEGSTDASTGTFVPQGWPMTEGTHIVSFDGVSRTYRIRHQQNWDGVTPMRLVFSFHACSGNPPLTNNGLFYLYRNTTWDYTGPEGGFMVVGPEAENLPCFDTDPNGNDVAFVTALIQESEAWQYTDASQRFLMGMSGGGYMTHAMACLLGADKIYAAMGGLAIPADPPADPLANLGTGFIDASQCIAPVEVFQSHGANDTTVPAAYGHEARDMWATVNGCTSPAASLGPHDFCTGNGYNNDPTDNPPADPCGCVEYTCTAGSLVYCEDGGGHDWFGEQKTSARWHFNSNN